MIRKIMPKKTAPSNSLVKIVRNSQGEFYRLSSGRLIPIPPKGGNVTRKAIREAVRSVVAEEKRARIG